MVMGLIHHFIVITLGGQQETCDTTTVSASMSCLAYSCPKDGLFCELRRETLAVAAKGKNLVCVN